MASLSWISFADCDTHIIEVVTPLFDEVAKATVNVGVQSEITDKNGLACLYLKPGTYPIRVSAPGFHTYKAQVTVDSATKRTIVVLRAARMNGIELIQTLRGKLLSTSKLREQYWVVVNDLMGDLMGRERVNSNGTFILPIHDGVGIHVARIMSRSKIVACTLFEMDAGDKYLEISIGESKCLN